MADILKGKSAVVTGAGGTGIGHAVALALAAEGASVVAVDIGKTAEGKNNADITVEEIKQAGGKAVACLESVASMEGGAKIVKTAVDNFGKIDILVNCAGNFKSMSSLAMTEADWDSIMAVHLKGHFACTKAAMEEMVKQKSGRIINFSSRGAFNGPPTPKADMSCLAYNTAKAGIIGFTAALADELRENNITVNAVLPSALTPLFPFNKKPLTDNIPVPKSFEPEYVTPVVVYFASDAAADVTGQFVYACGGDVVLFGKPFKLPGPHVFARSKGEMFTQEELDSLLSMNCR